MNKKPIFTFGKEIDPKLVTVTNNHFMVPLGRVIMDFTAETSEVNMDNLMLIDKALLKPEQITQIEEWVSANASSSTNAWDLWEQYYMEGGV